MMTLAKLMRRSETAVFLIVAAIMVVIGLINPAFWQADNLFNLLRANVIIGIMALSVLVVMISGGIDVSFPALASLAVYALTRLLVDSNYTGGVWLPFVLAMVFGALLGAFNGLFTARLALPTLIITLGTASVFSGVMQGVLSSVQIPVIPPSMEAFGRSTLFVATNPKSGLTSNMPVSFLILVAVLAAVFVMMRYTMFGRGIYAIGGDESAASRAGFKVRRIKFWLYVLVGVIAALAGLIRTSMMGQMHPTNLLGMEMMVIAAVVLGGTAITGGTGSLTGVMLGTLLITIVQNSMILMGIPTFWQGFSLGVLIIVGTGISAVQVARSGNRLRAAV